MLKELVLVKIKNMNGTRKKFTIRDLAHEFDVTTRTLRFYEEKGLLSPTRRGQNRIFSSADRTRLKLIIRGKRLGLSLDESAEIIRMYDPQTDNKKQLQALIQKICDKRTQLEKQRDELDLMIIDLKNWEERTLQAMGGSKENQTT